MDTGEISCASRRARLFELLRQSSQAELTQSRLDMSSRHRINEDTASAIRNHAVNSLRSAQRVSPDRKLRKTPTTGLAGVRFMITQLVQKNALASRPTVMAPMTCPVAGSAIAMDT